MSFLDSLDELLSGAVGDPGSEKLLREALKSAQTRVKTLEEKNERLRRKAQNNIDRSWNRALDCVKKVDGLTLDQVEKIEDLAKHVRHGDEFGHK